MINSSDAEPAPAAPKPSTARWGSEVQSSAEQGDLKRFAILRTAAELFNERGFYETSLNELAKRLNVTKKPSSSSGSESAATDEATTDEAVEDDDNDDDDDDDDDDDAW